MEFRILGALEVRHDGREVLIRGILQRKALAVLLLDSGRTVSMQRLIEALWSGEPPATARRQVRNIVAAVRRCIAVDDPIERSGDGYRLRTESTDWHDFRTEVGKAKASGNHAESHLLLRQALQRWRGPVLAGLDCEYIAVAALGMEEERIAALEDFHEAGLALGLHREVAGDIQSLVAEHPYRRRLNGHLMLALYRSGNGAAALRVYTDLAARLADELGIEPDRRLRDRYVAILREDPSLELEPPTDEAGPSVRARPKSESADTGHAAVEGPEEPLTDRRRAPVSPTDPEPSSERAERDPSKLASRSFSRLIALSLVVFVVVLGTSGDGLGLILVQGPLDPIGATRGLVDPVWTYPAMEPGSAVMAVDAGLLVLDGNDLRLESDGEVVWSERTNAQSIPSVAVFNDAIVLSSSAPVDQPWSTGGMTGINIHSGREVWSAGDRWPVARTEDAIITVGCDQPAEATARACVMESIEPRSGLTQWEVPLDHRSMPLRSEASYDSPWEQSLPTDYLLFRSYSGVGEDTGERLSVYDTDTGSRLGVFDFEGIEGVQINDELLVLHDGSTLIAEGQCEAHVVAYELGTAESVWERYMETGEGGDEGCLPLPTLEGAGGLFPGTLRGSASVVWARNGELQWTVPESSTAELLIGDSLVTTEAASDDIAVWDVWTHEQRWRANRGESMWARGSTLWVLDRAAVGPDCGGVVGYSLDSGASVCLPGSLEYLSGDEVVTADNGTWRAWPADPWG